MKGLQGETHKDLNAVGPDKGCTVCGFCIYSLTHRKVVILACDQATVPPPRNPLLSLVGDGAGAVLQHSFSQDYVRLPLRRTTMNSPPARLVGTENSRGDNC